MCHAALALAARAVRLAAHSSDLAPSTSLAMQVAHSHAPTASIEPAVSAMTSQAPLSCAPTQVRDEEKVLAIANIQYCPSLVPPDSVPLCCGYFVLFGHTAAC